MSTAQKISQAKSKLLVDYPYFGTVASKLELKQNDDIESFKNDGITLEYNDDYIDSLDLSEMKFVLANGAMHASLSHENRKNGRSGWLWHMATDFAINDMLVENGFDLPERAQYRKRFAGMYAEEIYAELKDDILRDDLEYETDDVDDIEQKDDKSEEKDSSKELSNEELQEEILQEQLFAEEMLALLETEINRGEAPNYIERFFKLESSSKIDWRNELKVALDRFHKDDYMLIPPNKKFLYLGYYLPSSISQKFELVIAVDSSGSVDDKLLNSFLSEIDFLMSSVANYQIDLLVCDDKVHSHVTFYSGDILECELKGSGGTDFRPVFEFIQNELENTKLLLYFTDLEGTFPESIPSYDVKWVTPKEEDVPFGEVLLIDED